MNYFIGIVLCITTVNAEAMPDVLTLDSVQDFLYQAACKNSVALRIVYPELKVTPTPQYQL